ncbi:hypothetical protein B0H10DRAFT_2037544 [Mycena sp. CBHHK59/15]|nr:hypothetical protein B0H10DRAFT_2037544 [Mycena sp. CBHHK59/15]
MCPLFAATPLNAHAHRLVAGSRQRTHLHIPAPLPAPRSCRVHTLTCAGDVLRQH